jgi:hypothetical protein
MLLDAARRILRFQPPRETITSHQGSIPHIYLQVADTDVPISQDAPMNERAFGVSTNPGALELRFPSSVDEHAYAHLYTNLSFYLFPFTTPVTPLPTLPLANVVIQPPAHISVQGMSSDVDSSLSSGLKYWSTVQSRSNPDIISPTSQSLTSLASTVQHEASDIL